MVKYLRLLAAPAIAALTLLGLTLGGAWMWMGVVVAFFIPVAVDLVLPVDLERRSYRFTWPLDAVLYLALPAVLGSFVLLCWMLGEGSADLLGIGAFVQRAFGHDMFAAREASRGWHYAGAVYSVGMNTLTVGSTAAHELFHRTQSPVAWAVGRWLMAMSCNADFAIEHVYGHHETLCTPEDPGTPRRGESLYAFVPRSTFFGHLRTWRLERERLRKRGHPVWSWRNLMLRGYAMSLLVIALFFLAAGAVGVLVFLIQAAIAKALIENINYIEHYGLLRVPGTPVDPRHSWNTNARFANMALFSLPRHSHHHERAELPYWELEPYPGAPDLGMGYAHAMLVSQIPPLWHATMSRKLIEWDRDHAAPGERELARRQNLASGVAVLRESAAAA